jgi:hypothetical protein
MKTTKNSTAAIIFMMIMIFSTSVNSQTITVPSGVTYKIVLNQGASDQYGAGKQVIVTFSQPVDLTVTTTNSVFTLTNRVMSKGTDNITFADNSTSKVNVVTLIVNFTDADAALKVVATKNTSTYDAIYNAGVTVGKATCTGTKTEILKSEQTISVYPNPTETDLNIEVDGSKLNTNVSDLTSGYYLINIIDMTGKLVKTEKLIKQ